MLFPLSRRRYLQGGAAVIGAAALRRPAQPSAQAQVTARFVVPEDETRLADRRRSQQ